MRYLVTGGCGFIGSHLTRALIGSGHQVRILDDLSTGLAEHAPPEAELQEGDVRCAATVAAAMAEADGCFHLAAIASVERCHHAWRSSHDVNLGGTINVFDACRHGARGPVPVVYASSSAIYGDQAVVPLPESSAPHVLSAYGADKLGGELHAAVAAHVYGLPTVGLRLFNVYGPRQQASSPYSGVIALFGARILAGLPLTIYGDGEQLRDFVYVADAARCFMAAMERGVAGPPRAELVNVCTGRPTSVNQLAAMLAEIAGRAPVIRHEHDRRGDIRASVGDPARCTAILGITPATDLATGLRETLDWLETCPPAPGS